MKTFRLVLEYIAADGERIRMSADKEIEGNSHLSGLLGGFISRVRPADTLIEFYVREASNDQAF